PPPDLVATRVLPRPSPEGGAPAAALATAPEEAPAADLGRLRSALGQLAEGLLVLHGAGKVHRDVKPSNVLVDLQGRVVLLDFGLAIESRGSGGEDLVGTPVYMAPEQAALRAVGPAADWYAVGAMLYEALAGRLPFIGTLSEILADKQVKEPPPPGAFRPAPPDLESLAMDLLRLDPAARPTGTEVLRRLEGEAGAQAAARAAGAALLAAPSSVFVGRRPELGAVARALEGTARGRAEVVLISGEQGIGKTALARRAVTELQASRRRVIPLFGRCYEREALPFKALDEIVDALSGAMLAMPPAAAPELLPPDAPLLARIFPVLNRVEPLQRMPLPEDAERLDGPQLRARAFVALRELLRRLCARHPVALVVDDLQWADQDSLALLSEILHPPDAPPVAALFTLRTPPGEAVWSIPAARTLEAVVGEMSPVGLGPLPLEDAQALARLLSAGEDSAALRQAAQEAGGHPLFIHELVRHALAAPAPAGAAPIVTLQDAIAARLKKLEPGPRALLEVLCVASAPLPQGLVFEAAGMDVREGARHLPALRAAHLARTDGPRAADLMEPFHDRVRDGVLARLPPGARRELHRDLASVLRREGAPSRLRLLVRCLEAAGEVEQAAAQAQRAAELAAGTLAFDSAADLFAEALRLGRHPPEHARRLQRSRAEALAGAGRGPEAAA
ncbi:MAG TPA: AAA family ATPase, partial [Myxococcales bacterium]|nr:AAA family ATPase [Myxococcales bacterium]